MALRRPPFRRAVGIVFETAWRNARACVALSAVYAALTAVPNVVFTAFAPEVDPLRMSGAEAYAIAAFAVAALATFVLGGLVVLPATLGGLSLIGAAGVALEPVSPRALLRRAIDRSLAACGAFALVVVATLALPAVLVAAALLVAVAAGSHTAIPLFGLALVSVVAPGAYVFVRLSLAVPIAVLEEAGPVQSVRRSWELMRGAFWWTLGVYVLILLVSVAAVEILGVIHLTTRTASTPDFVIATVRNFVAGMFAVSIFGVAIGVVYASREVPPDDAPARRARRDVPVPIPLDAFDPPPPR